MTEVRSVVRLLVFCGAVSLSAGPAEDAIIAIMRLSDQANYTWLATISDDARTYEINGKTERSGYSLVRMPMINSVRRKLDRESADTHIDLIFRGNVDCVLRTDDGWLRPDELPEPEEISDFDRLGLTGPAAIAVTRANASGVLKRPAIRRPASSRRDAPPAYSNLQLAISPPHEELAVIVGSHRDLKVDGDIVTGVLTDLGAQLLLVRDGQKEITPLQARGDFKIWLRDGMVARYQVNLDGTLEVSPPRGARVTVLVNQRSTTVISDVGTTVLDVPEGARAKLAQR